MSEEKRLPVLLGALLMHEQSHSLSLHGQLAHNTLRGSVSSYHLLATKNSIISHDGLFISIEGALRLPTTYDNHPIPSVHPHI